MGSPPGIDKWKWYKTPERQLILVLMFLFGKGAKRGVAIKEYHYFLLVKKFIPHVLDYFDAEGFSQKVIYNRFKQRADKTNRYDSENPENRPKDTGRFLAAAKKIVLDNKPLSKEDVSRIVRETELVLF